MKKLLIFLMLTPLLGVAQQIEKITDEFTGDVTYTTDKGFFEKTTTTGILITPFIFDGTMVFHAKWAGGGTCNEENEIIFLLESGERVFMKSYGKFNCDASCFFKPSQKDASKLSMSKVKMVRFKNGYTYDVITIRDVQHGDYFIKLFENIKALGL